MRLPADSVGRASDSSVKRERKALIHSFASRGTVCLYVGVTTSGRCRSKVLGVFAPFLSDMTDMRMNEVCARESRVMETHFPPELGLLPLLSSVSSNIRGSLIISSCFASTVGIRRRSASSSIRSLQRLLVIEDVHHTE